MSIVKTKKWNRIEEYVGDVLVDIFYLDEDKNIYVIGTEAADFAEYESPRRQANKTWNKIKERLPESMQKLSSVSNLGTPSNQQQSRFYMNELAHFFIMHLGTNPKVSLLLHGYSIIVEKFRKGELVPNFRDKRVDKQLEVIDKLLLAQTNNFQEIKIVSKEVKTIKTEVVSFKKGVNKRIDNLEMMVLFKEDRNTKNGEVKELQWKLKKGLFVIGDKSEETALGRMSSYVHQRYRVTGYSLIPDKYIDEYISFLKYCFNYIKKHNEIPKSLRYEIIPTVKRIPKTIR